GVWPGVPVIPTLASLGVIVGILAVVTSTSLYATRNDRRGEEQPEHQTGHVSHPGGIPRIHEDAD
ncbi:MAG: TerC family protein, partial [Nocardioides sp.]|nr:TerC family protein [Nocardioides sp.]